MSYSDKMKTKTKKLIAAFYFNYAAAVALKATGSSRRWWVRPAWTRRKSEGAYDKLVLSKFIKYYMYIVGHLYSGNYTF